METPEEIFEGLDGLGESEFAEFELRLQQREDLDPGQRKLLEGVLVIAKLRRSLAAATPDQDRVERAATSLGEFARAAFLEGGRAGEARVRRLEAALARAEAVAVEWGEEAGENALANAAPELRGRSLPQARTYVENLRQGFVAKRDEGMTLVRRGQLRRREDDRRASSVCLRSALRPGSRSRTVRPRSRKQRRASAAARRGPPRAADDDPLPHDSCLAPPGKQDPACCRLSVPAAAGPVCSRESSDSRRNSALAGVGCPDQHLPLGVCG